MADECGIRNERSSPHNVLTKSVLLNREIHGFLIGGEKRLLFSEINEELNRRGIQREDIFDKLKTLQLQLSEATADQRSIVAAHLGLQDSIPLGDQYLIRQTDAERLCGAVMRSQKLASDADITENTFKVQHEIFGKSRGLFIPELYIRNCSECITCIQCRALLSPQDFVRHNHSPPKNQVRHWGLEATRWWRYVFVAKDQENREYFQRLLDELKHRFSSQCDDVMTLPATIKTAAAAGNKESSTTTASVFSQLAALQDVTLGAKSPFPNVPDAESLISLQRRQLYSRYDESGGNSRAYSDVPPSFAEIMASAMAAAAAAVASSAVKGGTGQLPSLFVPPPNIRLQDIFKTSSTTGSSESTSKRLDDGDDQYSVAAKRMRLESSPEGESNSDGSPLPSASENGNSFVTPLSEALATVAAITSHARLQSESASILALPHLLLGHSKPLPIVTQKCHDEQQQRQPEEEEDEDVLVVSDTSDDDSGVINNNNNNKPTNDREDYIRDSVLRQQLSDEVSLLKTAFARQLSSYSRDHRSSSSEVDEPAASSMLTALLESASAEHEVERLFANGLIDEFCKLRARHHTQAIEHIRQEVGSSNSMVGMPTPKHMTVMGKYLGELQEAKSDLEKRFGEMEARARSLTAELSRAKEDYNALSRRLVEKERESNEMRHIFNAILVGSSSSSTNSSSGFLSSAVSAALLGHHTSSSPSSSSSSSSTSQEDQLTAYQQQLTDQRRALMFLMASDKFGRAGTSCHASNELAMALNAVSSSTSQLEHVLSSST